MLNFRELHNLAHAVIGQDVEELIEFIRENFSLPVTQCERCDELTHDEDAVSIDDDEQWCESCARYHAYEWESDGCYHSNPEPEWDEYPSYHSSDLRRGFSGAVGIELELVFRDDASEVKEHASDCDVCLEEDSSMSEPNSAEVITHPFRGDRNGLKKLGGLTAFLDRVNARGWDHNNYGIHVNLNRGKMSNFDVLRATMFLRDNAASVASIAGRDRIYSGSNFGDTYVNRLEIARGYTAKYSMISADRNRVEFRIYQANAKPAGVRRAVRFSQDVMSFASRAGYAGLTWQNFVSAFPRWVETETAVSV